MAPASKNCATYCSASLAALRPVLKSILATMWRFLSNTIKARFELQHLMPAQNNFVIVERTVVFDTHPR